MTPWQLIGLLFAIVNVLGATAVTVHAVLWKRDGAAAIAWVGIAWLAPFIGSLAYLSLGINRIERRARKLGLADVRLAMHDQHGLTAPAAESIDATDCPTPPPPALAGLIEAGNRLTRRDLLPGNLVETLVDGDAAYPVMLEAIATAKVSITLASYIFEHDAAGRPFIEALVDAHARGVAVRVLIDGVGARYGKPRVARVLARRGVPAVEFLPTRLPRLAATTNMRLHRKILVVDGAIGFTGGTNIRAGHVLGDAPADPVRCLHFRFEGPVVSHLQHAFVTDWAFTTEEVLGDERWFPELTARGPVWCRGIEHGPDADFEKIADTLATAVGVAQRRVRIVTPYFLPSPPLITALNVAALRGVEVEIYLPSTNNVAVVQWACAAQLGQNLEKGCRVFQTDGPFDHSKLCLVDDWWSLVGSTNWDPRSLRLNFECNVECYCPELCRDLQALIDKKANRAKEVTMADWKSRPLPIRLRDGLARLFAPLL